MSFATETYLDILGLDECSKCSLRSAEKSVVLGHGNPNADLMIVGEIADDEDELFAEAFVILGTYLRKLLEKSGIDIDDCYITYGVKCPRTCKEEPTNNQAWVCREWLLKEIELVKPRIILTLGKLPASLLLNKKSLKLKSVLGQLIPVESTVVAPWYSLNYVLGCGKKVDKQTIVFMRKVNDELVELRKNS